ncbi:galactose ABC transporter substrate-binding protein [Oscillospiraceae bacterium PP1C4]
MKKCWSNLVLPLVTAILFSLLSTACTHSAPNQKNLSQIKIGVTLYRQDDTFISNIRSHLEDAAKARETEDNIKITLNVMDGKGNQGIQNDQVDKFLSQGYDVICVNEVDRTAASVIIDKAKAANIPVVFFNREPVEEDMQRWDKVYYVGSIAKEAGMMEGEIVVNAYDANPQSVDRNKDDKLQYVILEGEPGHQDAAIRTEFSVKTLTSSGIKAEKLANDTANWQRAQASVKMAQWIEEFGSSIEVVFSNNDDMALGAIDAYNAVDNANLPVIVGVDATPPAIEAIKNGTLTGTVLNDSKGQAQAIFNIAYALATGKDVKESVPQLNGQYVWMPHHIVTRKNVDQKIRK